MDFSTTDSKNTPGSMTPGNMTLSMATGPAMPMAAAAMPMAAGLAMPMASGAMPMAAGAAMPALVRRPSKKEREGAKRSAFYLGIPHGETRPRYEIWGTRMAHSYLTHFNTNSLALFYEPGSKFTFMNMAVPAGAQPGIANMEGAEAIYTHLQAFRQMKAIHLKSTAVQPMSNNNSIMVTMNLDIEPHMGEKCHVVTTLVLEKLPGKKPRRVIGEGETRYEACQYIANQTFMIVP